jgi:tyrosyl-tRNA synthetase
MNKKKKIIQKILERGVEEVIEKESLIKKLQSNKKLRIKFGIDPTKPDLHLGHTVPLLKLREFQKLGHQIVLIIGDFTAQIGDPSGQNKERKELSEKEVRSNMKTYLKQIGKLIDISKAEIMYNSKWHKKNLKEFLKITKAVTISQIMKREDFEKRIQAGGEVTVLEALYAILQGYDSVAVKADVEIGGADQKINLLIGRRIQKYFNLPPQDIITVPLLEGTDGVKKMSKSYNNYIGILEKPNEMFGKIMSIPDNLIDKYFLLLTEEDIPQNKNPYEKKLLLAEKIVEMYHSKKTAKKAKEEFIKVFSKKELPEKITELNIKKKEITLIELLLFANVQSKSEAKRLISQNAVKINNTLKTNPEEKIKIKKGDILKIGKRRFFKLI